MREISPSIAAFLADEIYSVQNERRLAMFFTHPIFIQAPKKIGAPKTLLKAELGGRIINNHTDGFGICTAGGKGFENDLFLIFRGTTSANNKADFLTDARTGLTRSSSGLPVRCGFHHCLSSIWVEYLMRKLMQALGMKVVKTREELTESIIRIVLRRIMETLYRQAKNAIKRI